MGKSIFFIVGFIMVISAPLMAEEMGKSAPSIALNPAVVNVGNLVASVPVIRNISVHNLGNSILIISKIKYY